MNALGKNDEYFNNAIQQLQAESGADKARDKELAKKFQALGPSFTATTQTGETT